jgi:hypothetical protein
LGPWILLSLWPGVVSSCFIDVLCGHGPLGIFPRLASTMSMSIRRWDQAMGRGVEGVGVMEWLAVVEC